MAENNPFGFDPDDLDRVVREAGEELRQLKDRVLSFLDAPEGPRAPKGAPAPETSGETGQTASTPASGSRTMPEKNDDAAPFGLPGRTVTVIRRALRPST